MCWALLMRTTTSLPDGRTVTANTVAETRVPAAEPKPDRLSMSAINGVRRQLAAELGTTTGRVLVDWFDFVLYDERYYNDSAGDSPARSAVTSAR